MICRYMTSTNLTGGFHEIRALYSIKCVPGGLNQFQAQWDMALTRMSVHLQSGQKLEIYKSCVKNMRELSLEMVFYNQNDEWLCPQSEEIAEQAYQYLYSAVQRSLKRERVNSLMNSADHTGLLRPARLTAPGARDPAYAAAPVRPSSFGSRPRDGSRGRSPSKGSGKGDRHSRERRSPGGQRDRKPSPFKRTGSKSPSRDRTRPRTSSRQSPGDRKRTPSNGARGRSRSDGKSRGAAPAQAGASSTSYRRESSNGGARPSSNGGARRGPPFSGLSKQNALQVHGL